MKTPFWRIPGILLVALLLPACGVGGGGTLTPTVAPQVPANLKALSGYHRVTLTWNSQSADSVSTVKRSLTSGGPYFPVSVTSQFTSPTTYVDSGLTNGTHYFYVVNTSDQFGQSQDSSEVEGIPGFTATSVAASAIAIHSLVVLQDRTLWSFGWDALGELGNGVVNGVSGTPAQVTSVSDVTAAAVGWEFSLALEGDGSVWAWGANDFGQLGQGAVTTVANPVAVQVPGLTNIIALSAGYHHALALTQDGKIWAWGDNTYGQIGNGSASATPISMPFLIPGLTGIVGISAGSSHNLALRQDGTVWAWGDDTYGSLGLGTTSTTPVSTPVQVANITGVVGIAAGAGTSGAIRQDGSLWLWGYNASNKLGVSSTLTAITLPTQMPGIPSVAAISLGNTSALALMSDSTVMAWGDNSQGECGLGTSSNTPVTIPTTVPTLQSIVAVTVGDEFAFAIRADGSVLSWGYNQSGQTGNGFAGNYDAPVQVPNITDVKAVAAGSAHTVVLRTDGTVWTWGQNSFGQLGNGFDSLSGQQSSAVHYQVPGLTGITSVSAVYYNSLAVKGDGTLWAWGNNESGQTGTGSVTYDQTSPVQCQNLSGTFTAMAGLVDNTTLALRSDGTVWGWGWDEGDLGTGITSRTLSYTPLQAVGLSGITSIAGRYEVLALKSDGTLWAWGLEGNIGTGSTGAVATPQQILSGVAQHTVGGTFSLAVKSDGTVFGWGSQAFGQLGTVASASPALVPIQMPNMSSVAKVAAGANHSVLLKTDGTVWGLGQNYFGNLGVDDQSQHLGPVQVLGLSGVTDIAAGDNFTLAIRSDGTLWAWGDNSYQQLGIPHIPMILVPTIIQ